VRDQTFGINWVAGHHPTEGHIGEDTIIERRDPKKPPNKKSAKVDAVSFKRRRHTQAERKGAGFALAFNGRTATDTRSELGGRFDRTAS
jgi:hypothetical protein